MHEWILKIKKKLSITLYMYKTVPQTCLNYLKIPPLAARVQTECVPQSGKRNGRNRNSLSCLAWKKVTEQMDETIEL